jgi:hypothetical protein
VRTTKQVRTHLLCDECEERFNAGGERWVLANAFQDSGQFPLQAALRAAKPVRDTETPAFSGIATPGVKVDHLVYFSASMFWRAAVHDWKIGERLSLGSYEDELRRYLLGMDAFPQNAVSVIYVSDEDTPTAAATSPSGGRARDEDYFQYSFHIPGLLFFLVLGKRMPSDLSFLCTVRSRDRLVFLSSKADEFLKASALKLIEASSEPN